jgi:hypothetical protein
MSALTRPYSKDGDGTSSPAESVHTAWDDRAESVKSH